MEQESPPTRTHPYIYARDARARLALHNLVTMRYSGRARRVLGVGRRDVRNIVLHVTIYDVLGVGTLLIGLR